MRTFLALALTVALLCALATAALADLPKPTAAAVEAVGTLKIDGVLDDATWDLARWHNEFRLAGTGPENQGDPHLAEVQTRFKVAYDPYALYVAVECDEPWPDKMLAKASEHDTMVFMDDCVEIFFDPAGDGRNYHHFIFNSLGACYDSYAKDYGVGETKTYDADLTAAAKVDAAGKRWTLEVRLPFASLILPPANAPAWVWNVSRERYATGKLELSSWSPLKGSFGQPRLFGTLTGVKADFKTFAFDLGEPQVSISGGGSGWNIMGIKANLRNNSGAARTLIGAALPFAKPAQKVETPPFTLAPGAEQTVTFPDLRVRSAEAAANIELAFRDATSGELLKVAVRQLSSQYKPIAIRVDRPVYRNNIYASERLAHIEFGVVLSPDIAAQATKVNYSLTSEGGAAVGQGSIPAAQLGAAIKLPAQNLAVGKYTLKAAALGANGQKLAETETTLRKLPPPEAGNEVRIDEHGNILVNGRPTVFCGWYGGVPTEDPREDVVALQNLQTPVVPSIPPGKTEFDLSPIAGPYQEHGIYSIASIEPGRLQYSFYYLMKPEQRELMSTELTKASAPSQEVLDWVWKLVQAVRGEPGLVGYYIADEPEINNTRSDYLQALYQAVAEMDPYHPIMVTNDTVDGIATHGVNNCDIFSPDPYSSNPTYVPMFLTKVQQVMHPGQAITLTPWASSGEAHFVKDWGSDPPYPYSIMRHQYLYSITAGCRGWTGYTTAFFMPEPVLRYGLPPIWREVRFLEQALAAPAPSEPLQVQSDQPLGSWIRQANGHTYLVVVNYLPGARQVRISHPLLKGLTKLAVVSEGRSVTVADGAFTDQFGEAAARIYSTDPAGAALPTTQQVEAEIAQQTRATVKPGNLLHVSTGTRPVSSPGFFAPWFMQYYYYAINGITDDLGWQASHANIADKPWLELTMKKPANVGRLVIYTPTLRDFDVRLQSADGAVSTAQIRGNQEDVVELNFDPAIPCLKVRVTALAVREGKAQISEIEAYTQRGTGRITPVLQQAAAAPAGGELAVPTVTGENVLWQEDFTNFEFNPKFNYDGKDTKWVIANPAEFSVTPRPGGGADIVSLAPQGYAAMQHFWPVTPAHRYLQVKVSDIKAKGYTWTTVSFGGPGDNRGAFNIHRPGLYTTDIHYVNPAFRDGTAKSGTMAVYATGSGKNPDGTIIPSATYSYDFIRLVQKAVDGLMVTLADGSPLPPVLKQGDELKFYLALAEPAQDAVVDIIAGSNFVPVAINGEPYVQLLKIGEEDGREWAAVVKLGPGTGKFDRKNDGYPLLFRARIVGGEIPETFFSGDFSIQ